MAQKLVENLTHLGTLLAAYQKWYAETLQRCFYNKGTVPDVPDAMRWLKDIDFAQIDCDKQYRALAKSLQDKHEMLMQVGNTLGAPPEPEAFTVFSTLFQDFQASLQKTYQTLNLEKSGIDVLTGLRNNNVLKDDVQKEMDILARDGSPFCLGLACIDDFERIEEKLHKDKVDDIIVKSANLIQEALRSYDVAYRVKRNYFILCLKQSDIFGGQKALKRLGQILNKRGETYYMDDGMQTLSISCCISAPFAEDDIETLIDDLYKDLKAQAKDSGAVLTYQELSPLQRFVKEGKDE